MISERQHTPTGVNDILKYECKLKRSIEKSVANVFETFCYQEIQTPSFEYLDVYTTHTGGIDQSVVYKFFDDKNRILALRPDITTSIARVCATKLREEPMPQRFFYIGNAYRAGEAYGDMLREFTQAGVELIGVAGPKADAEVIAVTINALLGAGLTDFTIEMGQVAFFKGLMESCGLSDDISEKFRELIDKKDSVALENLADIHIKNEEIKKIVVSLPLAFGTISVLDEINYDVLNNTAKEALDNLSAVYSILEEYGLGGYVSIDLGTVSHLEYYTGIVFKGLARGTGFSVCGGGRYDKLVGEFGKSAPATGVAIGINRIVNLLYTGEEPETAMLPVAVVGSLEPSKSYKVCFGLRAQGLKIEDFVSGGTYAEMLEYAEQKGIAIAIWADENVVTMKNVRTGETSETTLEKLLGEQK